MLADKKKLTIFGVLVIIVLCVGVFQFTGGSAPASKGGKSSKKDSTTKGPDARNPVANIAPGTQPGVPNPSNPMGSPNGTSVAMNGAPGLPTTQPALALPEHDPFDGSKYLPKDEKSSPAPKLQPKPELQPKPFTGGPKIPPLAPLPGKLEGPLGITQVPGLAEAPKDTFDYSVSGVVTGDRPIAVFQDSKGDQRLIQLGGALDGDTRVVSISRGKVTVNHHGKNMTLTVGASAPSTTGANNPTEKRSDEK